MSFLPINSNLYHHYLALSDHLIRAVAICIIEKLYNEDTETKTRQIQQVRSSGKSHTMKVLQRAPELELGQNSVLYEISEKLKLAITYRKQAQACYEEDPGKFHNDTKSKKRKKKTVSHPKTTFPKKGQKHRRGNANRGGHGNKSKKVDSQGKRHQGQIRIMEESLKEVMKILDPEPTVDDGAASNGERTEKDRSWSDTDRDESGTESDSSAESSRNHKTLSGDCGS